MKHKKFLALLLSAVLALGVLITGCSSTDTKGGLRSFTAATLDGGTFSQKDIQEKDLTVINFWGTFCSPCVGEMPYLAAFAKALPENVQFITVCIDADGNMEGAKELLQKSGYEGITLISGDGDFATLVNEIQSLPTTIFVDGKGSLVGDVIEGAGYEDQEAFSSMFLTAVNKALKASGKAEISLAY